MKKFISFLFFVLSFTFASAQDVIVKKDGSTIMSKVIEVGESEVKYKKFTNQNGPTYTISTRDLQCINYEDGSKDTFVSPNYNPSIVTNETATQFSNDQYLLKDYSLKQKGKNLKLWGWTICGASIIASVATIAACWGVPDNLAFVSAPLAAGACIGLPMVIVGNKKTRSAHSFVLSSPLYQHEFSITKNDRLMVGVDMLRDNTCKQKTLGLGISYKF